MITKETVEIFDTLEGIENSIYLNGCDIEDYAEKIISLHAEIVRRGDNAARFDALLARAELLTTGE